jgi:hypothetical protein
MSSPVQVSHSPGDVADLACALRRRSRPRLKLICHGYVPWPEIAIAWATGRSASSECLLKVDISPGVPHPAHRGPSTGSPLDAPDSPRSPFAYHAASRPQFDAEDTTGQVGIPDMAIIPMIRGTAWRV